MRVAPFRQQRFFVVSSSVNHLQQLPAKTFIASPVTTSSLLRSCSLAVRAPCWCIKWSAAKYSYSSSFLPWTILSASSFIQFRHSASSTSTSDGSDDQLSISEAITENIDSQEQQQQKPQDIVSSSLAEAKRELAAVLELITSETIDCLRPGNTIQHTDAPSYDVRANGALFKQLEGIVKNFSEKKEHQPLVTLVSLPRQGKTALLDAIGYNRDVIRALGDTDPDLKRTFVFNMSMNSAWTVDKKATYSFQEAQNEISFRIIATAAGISDPGHEDAQQIRIALGATNPSVDAVVGFVKVHISKLTKSSGFHYFFLFDEFTNLVDCLDNSELVRVKGKRCTPAQALYSSITSLISSKTVVVVSGFTGVEVKLTGSDRQLRHLVLTPIAATPERREVLVMQTKYFQRVVNTDLDYQKKVIYYYELCKSSRGVFGALLEKLDGFATTSSTTLSSAVSGLPIIGQIKTNETQQCKSGASESPHTSMNNVLEWKSVQHCAAHFAQLGDDDSLRQRMEVECRDAEELKVAQVPHGTLVWIPRDKDESSSIEVRLEPIFFSTLFTRRGAKHDSYFAVFDHMLMQYSYCFAALSKLDENKPLLQEVIYKRWIGGSTASSFVVPSEQIADFVKAHFETISVDSNPKLDSISLKSVGELNGNFLEDAIAVGIAFVFELRQRLAQRWKIEQPIVAPLKDFFISKTSTSDDGTTEVNFIAPLFVLKQNDSDPELQIEWTQSHNVTSDPIRIVDFDKEFPSKGNPSTNLPPFFHRTIFRPGRPESNPLLDVGFHEKIHTPASSSPSSSASPTPRLVQFWVDGKHTRNNPAKNAKKFAIQVANCLQDGRLQNSSDCVVDHVVHVIVSPFDASRAQNRTIEEALKKKITPSILGRLKSYTLYIISPDSVAFQHLVSQPIALSIPLMEPQYDNAWATKLKNSDISCYRYKGTLVKDVGHQLESFEDVRDWMRFRYDDDCVSTFINLFESLDEAKESIAAHFSKVPRNLPFGSILEGLKIRPLSWYGGRYHRKYGISFGPASSNSATTTIDALSPLPSLSMTISVFTERGNKDKEISIPVTEKLAVLLCSNIRVGHLLYDKQYDAKIWTSLFHFSANDCGSGSSQQRDNALKRWNQTLLDWHAEQISSNSTNRGIVDGELSSKVTERLTQLDYVSQLLLLLPKNPAGIVSALSQQQQEQHQQ